MSDQNTATAQVDANPAAPDFNSFIPAEFKDQPYMKTIKEPKDFFSQFHNMQSMIGKKTGLPGADATEQDWDAFFDTSGFRPKEAAAYEFQKPELPEGATLPEDYEARMRSMLHESGLSPVQAKRLMGKYNSWITEQYNSMHEQAQNRQKELDTEFETLAEKHFGKSEKDKVIATAKSLIAAHVPEELKAHLGQLDNNSLVLMSAFANAVAKKYISEDQLPASESVSVSGKSAADLDAEGIKIMQSPEFKDPLNPANASARAKVREIYEQVHRLEDAARKPK